MIKIYFIGICILVIAIIVNILASLIGLITWYDFLQGLSNNGLISIKEVGFINIIFLFIIYPLILGLAYLLGEKVFILF